MSTIHSRISPFLAGLLAVLAVVLFITPAQAGEEVYCSSQNTASDNTYYNWPYQSNGNCTNHCAQTATFAFAVLKWDDCWCSNYIPGQTTDKSRCDKDCPGFPAENCGNKDDNLYLYLKLNGQPSGTAGGSKPTSAPSAKPSSSPSSTPLPQTSFFVITESGAIITKTVIQTPSAEPTTSSSTVPVKTGDDKGGSNTGAIIGGAIGGALVLIAIIGGVFFLLYRRRKRQRQMHDDMNNVGIGGGSTGITRNTSTMSSAGLLGRGASSTSQYPPVIATNFSTANSRYGDQESISPISNRRNSQPLVIDSRLNPKAVLTFANSNASRDSLASMDDSRDYGRQLNVRNPDP